ncbi:hypothetical protein LTR49_000972 [Elasticomyces elasticus]|nr:hypothetical protein LTR49_000972 [Elasticomyces elasticus]
MSGVEVVGLVLGAFPLAISALEHYRDSCRVLNCLANFEQEYRKTLNDVKDEYLLYVLNLKVLLLPLVNGNELGEDDLTLLLTDATHEKWKNDDVEVALRERLDVAHGRFLEIAKDLQHLVWELLTVLGIDKPRLQARLRTAATAATQVAQHPMIMLKADVLKEVSKSSFEYRKEQLKFGFGKSQREELMKEIRATNKKLDRLLEKSEKVVSYQKSLTTRVSLKAVKSLLQYWKDADRVYTLIHRSWGCQCQSQHCAQLWLQHRTASTFEFKLLVLWSPRCVLTQPCPPWSSQGLRITRLEGTASSVRTAARRGVSVTGACAMASLSTESGPGILRSNKKTVQFKVPDIMLTTVSPCNVMPQVKRSKGSTASQGPNVLQEISELCIAMVGCGMAASCIGALTDVEKGNQYSVHAQPEQKITASETLLSEILSGPSKRRLKRSDRYRIALAVASSHLQLHSTSWARKQWEAHDIRFPCSGPNASDIMFDRPYVSADFTDNAPKPAPATERSFACLGIMLMELLFGVGLETHELWSNPGFGDKQNTSLYRQIVAREWADAVEGEAGPDLSAAVMWCLDESPTTLDGDQWRQDLAHKVVLPLQNCCDWISGKPAG